MIPLTRRAFLGLCALVSATMPRSIVSREDELTIVNGWILKQSDLRDLTL